MNSDGPWVTINDRVNLFCERKGVLSWIKGVFCPICILRFDGAIKMTGFVHETVGMWICGEFMAILKWNQLPSGCRRLIPQSNYHGAQHQMPSIVYLRFWHRSDNIFRCFLEEINQSQCPFNQEKKKSNGHGSPGEIQLIQQEKHEYPIMHMFL